MVGSFPHMCKTLDSILSEKVVLLATEKKSVSITSALESGINKRESPRPEGKMTQIKSNETQHKSHLQPVFVLRQQ